MLDSADTIAFARPVASRREQAKGERRARIVEATYDLLREVGVADLSMKAVAARAGVSLSTVYNLFESKQAVLATVFDQDLVKFEALVAAAPSADSLERIFDSIDIAAALYRADPGFYRATLWRRPGSQGADDLDAALFNPRVRFWRLMAEDAVHDGLLRADADAGVIATLMIQIFNGVLGDWIAGGISVDELRLEAQFGFAVAFSAFATPAAATRLGARVRTLHDALAASRRRAGSSGVASTPAPAP